MVKIVSAVLTAFLAATLALAPAPSSQADGQPAAKAAAVTGTVVTYAGGSVAGQTVRLRTAVHTGLGGVVDTATTNSKGQFSLTGGTSGSRYYVELVPGTFQRGWAGAYDPRYFQFRLADAATYPPNAKLGGTVATPSFVRGALVDQSTGQPVRGVKVTMTRLKGNPNPLTATSGRDGRFQVDGLVGEDFSMTFKGSQVGYENGYWGCQGNVVEPELECQAAIGVITKKIRIEKN